MGKDSAIGWTNNTWNPWRGCVKVSAGCKNCYMFRDQERYGRDPRTVVRAAPATFNAPLKWADPALVFTCSWSDWFIEAADSWRDEAWDIVRRTPHLTYQILTKRPENIAARLPADWRLGYPNVWLGISAEDQATADLRIPQLRRIQAAVRFVSAEPLLGPINFGRLALIDWMITGGESGPDCRPADPEWFRSIRDQCRAGGVPLFHKQNGGRGRVDGHWGGRMLDGRTWDEYPVAVPA